MGLDANPASLSTTMTSRLPKLVAFDLEYAQDQSEPRTVTHIGLSVQLYALGSVDRYPCDS